jgi:hypothetical protein
MTDMCRYISEALTLGLSCVETPTDVDGAMMQCVPTEE